MSYIARVKLPDERILYIARLHWIVYVVPMVALTVGFVLVSISIWPAYNEGRLSSVLMAFVGLGLLGYGLVMFFRAWWQHGGTELSVTNMRVIAKTGMIWRRTWEINADKIEGVNVEQSVLGRILDFGTVIVTGAGAAAAPMKNIAHPLEFRTHVTLGPEAGARPQRA
jgi:uncharacterized membrane protein YdbT with pleckstrin-like domain